MTNIIVSEAILPWSTLFVEQGDAMMDYLGKDMPYAKLEYITYTNECYSRCENNNEY